MTSPQKKPAKVWVKRDTTQPPSSSIDSQTVQIPPLPRNTNNQVQQSASGLLESSVPKKRRKRRNNKNLQSSGSGKGTVQKGNDPRFQKRSPAPAPEEALHFMREKLPGVWVGCLKKKGFNRREEHSGAFVSIDRRSSRVPMIHHFGENLYNEIVIIKLDQSGICSHCVALPQFGEVLGNHLSEGKWDVQVSGNVPYIKILLKTDAKQKLKMAFDIEESDKELVLVQSTDGGEVDEEGFYHPRNNRSSKKRTPLALKRLKDPDKDLEAFLEENIDEVFRVECLKAMQISGRIYKRFGISIGGIDQLNGIWKVAKPTPDMFVCGEDGAQSETDRKDLLNGLKLADNYKSFIYNFAKVDQIKIEANKAWIEGHEYEVNLQEKYSLETYDLKNTGYSLYLQRISPKGDEDSMISCKPLLGKDYPYLHSSLSDTYALSVFQSTDAGLVLCLSRDFFSNGLREGMASSTIFLTRVNE